MFGSPSVHDLPLKKFQVSAKNNKKAVLVQGNRAMPQLFFSI